MQPHRFMCRHFTQYYFTYSDKLRIKNKKAESRRKYFSRERCRGVCEMLLKDFELWFFTESFCWKNSPKQVHWIILLVQISFFVVKAFYNLSKLCFRQLAKVHLCIEDSEEEICLHTSELSPIGHNTIWSNYRRPFNRYTTKSTIFSR